jgi:hypothetical protein
MTIKLFHRLKWACNRRALSKIQPLSDVLRRAIWKIPSFVEALIFSPIEMSATCTKKTSKTNYSLTLS